MAETQTPQLRLFLCFVLSLFHDTVRSFASFRQFETPFFLELLARRNLDRPIALQPRHH